MGIPSGTAGEALMAVSEEMVERACTAFHDGWAKAFSSTKVKARKRMRAALTAALSDQVVVPKMPHDYWKVGDKLFHKSAGERGEITKIENGDIHVQFKEYSGVFDRTWFGTYPDSLIPQPSEDNGPETNGGER
jgi:hypothetical protein